MTNIVWHALILNTKSKLKENIYGVTCSEDKQFVVTTRRRGEWRVV